jgi:hypothetical protein
MCSRWEYIGRDGWVPGRNVPALGRGGVAGSRSLNAAGLQIIGNLITNVRDLPPDCAQALQAGLSTKVLSKKAPLDPVSVVAGLIGVSPKTVRGWHCELENRGWGSAFVPKSHSTADGVCNDSSSIDVQTSPFESELPQVEEAPPEVGDDDDDDLEQSAAPEVQHQVEMWRAHPNFSVGIRIAELASMWLVQGWAKETFPQFTHWFRERLPHALGNIHLSGRFLDDFQASLIQALHTCTASSLHSIVPALGIPSLLSRVIDVVTINGKSLLPVIQLYTDNRGKVSWALLGCPCLEHTEQASPDNSAAAVGAGPIFGFHKARQLIRAVHAVEATYHINKLDRGFRQVLTVADQAIQGPGSVQFTPLERKLDGLPPDPLAEAVCKFHIADGVGCGVDKRYGETFVFDRLLRLIRRHFAFGTGDLILRAVARKFEGFVADFKSQSTNCSQLAAKAEANVQPLAAARLHNTASKVSAEAQAIVHAGWTSWHRPLAPKADGTRKVVYQTRARGNFFKIYGLVFWGLQARMQQSLENARLTREKTGPVSEMTGLNTKEMKSWRSLGRAMTDIPVLVFNLGRLDFRKMHLVAYALESQKSLSFSSVESAIECSNSMQAAVGTIVEMRGILLMIQHLASGFILEKQESGWFMTNRLLFAGPYAPQPGRTALWWTCKTLLTHRCWRKFPSLTSKLTEIVLGGSLCGVPLHSAVFAEPVIDGKASSGTTSSTPRHPNRPTKLNRGFDQRNGRFNSVVHALDRLIHWAKAERHDFLLRILGVASPKRFGRVAQGTDADLPVVLDIDEGGIDVNDDEEVGEDAAEGPRCSFAPSRCSDRAAGSVPNLLDMLHDTIVDKQIVEDAALELETACGSMGPLKTFLREEDLTQILASTSTATENQAGHESDTSNSEDEPEEGPTPAIGGGASSSSGSPSAPPPSSLPAPRMDYMIWRNKTNGMWTFWPLAKYNAAWATRMVNKFPARGLFLYHVEQLFGTTLALKATPVKDVSASLRVLHIACQGRVWGITKASVRDVMKSPPEELFAETSLQNFGAQFDTLREWVQSLRQLPYGHEFSEPNLFTIRRVGVDDKPFGDSFEVKHRDIIEASRWPHRFVPKLPVTVLSRSHGKCLLEAVSRRPDMNRLYSHVLTTPLNEIRCRGIWHIVAAWHFAVHASTSSESLAESVGSFLEVSRRHNLNGKLATKRVVWSSQLRAAGLRGFGGEEAILSLALNVHFQSHGPEGWHFHTSRAIEYERTRAAFLHRDRALQNRPDWFHTCLTDLEKTGRHIICKSLPRPEEVLISRKELASRWQQENTTVKRQRLAERSDDLFEPCTLAPKLWRQLGISVLSLPNCLRPGTHAR